MSDVETRLGHLEKTADQTREELAIMRDAVQGIDRSLAGLVAISRQHTETKRNVDNLGLIVERHTERLDSIRWALRLIVVTAVGALGSSVGALYALL